MVDKTGFLISSITPLVFVIIWSFSVYLALINQILWLWVLVTGLIAFPIAYGLIWMFEYFANEGEI